MRADARANRQALLQAAWVLFAEKGTDVHMRTIAQTAGVGIGTLYRHFPTYDDLLISLLSEVFMRITDIAEEHLKRWDTNPERTWEEFIHAIGALGLGALSYRLGPHIQSSPDIQRSLDGFIAQSYTKLNEITDRAKEAHLVDKDVRGQWIFTGLAAITRPAPHEVPPEVAEQLEGHQKWLIDTYIRGLKPEK